LAFSFRALRWSLSVQISDASCDAASVVMRPHATGIPEPGPKREEKQKVELAAADLRMVRRCSLNR